MEFQNKFGTEGFQYCLRISALKDFTDYEFCSKALLEHFDHSLPLGLVQKMQKFLFNLDDSDKQAFNLALKTQIS